MGTNYYLIKDKCEFCERYEKLHIGKSSYGWHFALHVTDEIKDFGDWVVLFSTEDITIEDEYGAIVSIDEMINIITKRSSGYDWDNFKDPYYKSEDEFHSINHSERGINGLVRSKLDGHHCVGHGNGTWDLITGEFY